MFPQSKAKERLKTSLTTCLSDWNQYRFTLKLCAMKASEKFKTAIETYLNVKALTDALFADSLKKETKNLESCFHYIFGEVKKTGECAFDNQEIFDMAEKYYTDDSIGTPAPIQCRVAVTPPAKPDLFSTAPAVPENEVQKTETVPPPVKPVQQTLTLFDL